jgi:hypothetical protein
MATEFADGAPSKDENAGAWPTRETTYRANGFASACSLAVPIYPLFSQTGAE